MWLNKIIAPVYFQPTKRKFKEARVFLEKFKNNPHQLKVGKTLDVVTNNLPELTKIMTETLSHRFKNPKNYKQRFQRLLFHPLASKNDSCHSAEVRKLMKEGMHKMEDSNDPFHDISHVYRCIRLAKLYYGIYKIKDTSLDWGTLVTAIIFHDISRVKLGSFFQRSFLNLFGKIPFVMDLALIRNVMSDAESSAEIFYHMSSTYNLPNGFVVDVLYGILGTSPLATKQKLNDYYFKIVCDVDKLDLCTIGRFESALQNVTDHKMATMQYFNRCNYLVSRVLNKCRDTLNLNISQPIFDYHIETLKAYGLKFYPQDVEILSSKKV